MPVHSCACLWLSTGPFPSTQKLFYSASVAIFKINGIIYPGRPHYWGVRKATGEEKGEEKKSGALDWSRQEEGELRATINCTDKLGGIGRAGT